MATTSPGIMTEMTQKRKLIPSYLNPVAIDDFIKGSTSYLGKRKKYNSKPKRHNTERKNTKRKKHKVEEYSVPGNGVDQMFSLIPPPPRPPTRRGGRKPSFSWIPTPPSTPPTPSILTIVSSANKAAETLTKSVEDDFQQESRFVKMGPIAESAAKSEEHRNQVASDNNLVYDKDLSTYNKAVFYDPLTAKVIVSFRSTQVLEDLVPDFHIATKSRKHARFDEAVQFVDSVKQKYGSEVIVTGHSLGGTLALYVNQHYKGEVKAHAFNPGASPFGEDHEYYDAVIYRNKKDIISIGGGQPKGATVVEFEGSLVHPIAYFINPFVAQWYNLENHYMPQFENEAVEI